MNGLAYFFSASFVSVRLYLTGARVRKEDDASREASKVNISALRCPS